MPQTFTVFKELWIAFQENELVRDIFSLGAPLLGGPVAKISRAERVSTKTVYVNFKQGLPCWWQVQLNLLSYEIFYTITFKLFESLSLCRVSFKNIWINLMFASLFQHFYNAAAAKIRTRIRAKSRDKRSVAMASSWPQHVYKQFFSRLSIYNLLHQAMQVCTKETSLNYHNLWSDAIDIMFG